MKLLVLDVEGTLFRTHIRLPGASIDSTIWQAIAHALGPEAIDAEVATHGKWDRGEYPSYIDWMKDTIRIHQEFGLTQSAFERIIQAAEFNPGVVETLRDVDRSVWEPVLVTGGFRELAARVQRAANVHHAFAACEYFFDADRLSGFNLLPCDFEGKMDFIQLMLREYRLGENDWVFVGDGRNDVPIARRASLSIGYQPHEQLKAVVHHTLNDFRGLGALLRANAA